MTAVQDEPAILRPFNRDEAISTATAAEIADRSIRTVRRWCACHAIGRRIRGGEYAVSRPALAMFLDGDSDALEAYLAGDRQTPLVTEYFSRLGVALPRGLSLVVNNEGRTRCA
jgi:hypothetical protein